MPCYNQVDYIRAALDSALNQNYENFEIVIGDDGSKDGSKQIIDEYAKKFPNIIVPLVHANNLGININFNNILKNCKGKYIAVTSADDLFLQGKLKEQVEWMERNSDFSLCGHKVDWIDENGSKISHKGYKMESGSGPGEFIKKGPLYASTSLMVRADKIPKSGFDERIKIISDWKFQIDILWNNEKYGFIDKCFAQYRRHEGNTSKTKPFVIFLDQLSTCYLVLKRSRGKYLLHCIYFIIYGAVRKLLKKMIW